MSGPVQVLVVGFDEPTYSGAVVAELDRLGETGVVRLVDVLLVRRGLDGGFEVLPPPPGAAPDLGRVAAHVLGSDGDDETDDPTAWSIADAVEPGGVAAVALLEHLWARPLVDAITSSGGRPLAELWLSAEDRARMPGG